MDPDFFDQFTHASWDIPLWSTLAARLGGPILEVGCGTGRVCGPLRDEGHDIWGIELDPDLAARSIERIGPRVFIGDLHSLRLGRHFPTVFVPGNTLALFEDPTTALRNIRSFMTNHGNLVFDLVMPGDRPWAQAPFRWSRERAPLIESGRYDPVTRRHDGRIQSGTAIATRTTWIRSLPEWSTLLRGAGLQPTGCFGSGGAPATEADAHVFILARAQLPDPSGSADSTR